MNVLDWLRNLRSPRGGTPGALDADQQAARALLARLPALPRSAEPWSTGTLPQAGPLRPWLEAEVHGLQQLPASPLGTRALQALHRALRRADLGVDALASHTQELLGALQDESATIQQISALVEADPALQQQVWTLASAARFAAPPRDTQYAIARVGVVELGRLSAAQVVADRLCPAPFWSMHARALRAHSLQSAHLAALRWEAPGAAAWLGGSLQAVGALYLCRFQAEEGQSARLLRQMMARYGDALGQVLLEQWGLPPRVAAAVGHQSQCDRAADAVRPLSRLIRQASVAIHTVQAAAAGTDCGGVAALAALGEVEPLLWAALRVLRQSPGIEAAPTPRAPASSLVFSGAS